MSPSTKHATCQFCHREFKNQQAVRAHLRHCAAYRQKTALGSVPKAGLPSNLVPRQKAEDLKRRHTGATAPPNASEIQTRPRYQSRQDQGNLVTMLTIRETLEGILEECANFTWYARLTSCRSLRVGQGTEEDWRELCSLLLHCKKLSDTMAKEMVLDRERLAPLYRQLVTVKSNWLKYRRTSLDYFIGQLNIQEDERPEYWKKEYDGLGIKEEEHQLAKVIEQVKKLLVSC